MPGGPQPGGGRLFHTPPQGRPPQKWQLAGGGVPPRPRDSCCWVPDPTPAGLRGLLWVCGCAGSLKTWLECRLTSGDTSEACPLQMMSGPRRFSPCRRSDRAPPSSCCLSRGSRAGSSVTPASNQIWLLQEQNRTLSCCPSLGPGVPGGAWRGRARGEAPLLSQGANGGGLWATQNLQGTLPTAGPPLGTPGRATRPCVWARHAGSATRGKPFRLRPDRSPFMIHGLLSVESLLKVKLTLPGDLASGVLASGSSRPVSKPCSARLPRAESSGQPAFRQA